MSVPKPPFHSVTEELLYGIYSKFTADMNALKAEDINTLAKLNSILTDADLVKVDDLSAALAMLKGNVPPIADTLEKIFNIIQGLSFLTTQDIDTLAELNSILGDADLVKSEDLNNALNALEFNQWRFNGPGDIAGSPVIDLTGKSILKFTQTGGITDFDFTGEVSGRHYLFIVERSANHTFQLKAGRYYLPFGNPIALSDPTTNGSVPPYSRDIITAVCFEAGKLTLVPSHNFLPN